MAGELSICPLPCSSQWCDPIAPPSACEPSVAERAWLPRAHVFLSPPCASPPPSLSPSLRLRRLSLCSSHARPKTTDRTQVQLRRTLAAGAVRVTRRCVPVCGICFPSHRGKHRGHVAAARLTAAWHVPPPSSAPWANNTAIAKPMEHAPGCWCWSIGNGTTRSSCSNWVSIFLCAASSALLICGCTSLVHDSCRAAESRAAIRRY